MTYTILYTDGTRNSDINLYADHGGSKEDAKQTAQGLLMDMRLGQGLKKAKVWLDKEPIKMNKKNKRDFLEELIRVRAITYKQVGSVICIPPESQ